MTLQDYIDANPLKNNKLKGDIEERWQNRIVANGWQTRGEIGAQSYLAQYGKGISEAKVVALAQCADAKGFSAFALGFWKVAYELAGHGKAGNVSREPVASAPLANAQPIVSRASLELLPQLPSPVESDADVERLLLNSSYGLQEKHDGHHRIIRVSANGEVSAGNKQGLATTLPPLIAAELEGFVGVVDGELVGLHLYLYDLLEVQGRNVRSDSYQERYERLTRIIGNGEYVSVSPLAIGREKRGMLERIRADGLEGVVFKRLDAEFVAGKDGSHLKHKFVASASCLVVAHNKSRSVQIAVLDQGIEMPLGNVTIPVNHPVPPVSAIIEVEYLYLLPGGSLQQPVYKGERDDVSREECVIEQLKYKAGAVAA